MRRGIGFSLGLLVLVGFGAVGYGWVNGHGAARTRLAAGVAGTPSTVQPAAPTVLPAPSAEAPPANRPAAPDFRVKTTSGTPFVLSAARGQVVVMEFLSAGCESCKPQVQALKAADAKLAARGVKVLLVDETSMSDREILDYYRGELGGGPHLYAGDTDGGIARAYDVQALGTTFVIDPRGRIAFRDIDPPASTLISAVQRSLQEA